MGWMLREHGEDLYHHIYAWGNDHHPIFKSTWHYEEYLILLEKYALLLKIDVIAYALMETHVHLFVYDRQNCISDFMMKLHGDYARYYNRVNERVGHVFGERFNNKVVLANIYGKWLSRYIHRQAVDAGLVSEPVDFPWSSYRTYIELEKREFVKPDVILTQFGDKDNRQREYQAFVLSGDDGPFDWGRRTFKLVGGHDLIHYICQDLDIDVAALVNPQGAKERHVRHDAIRYLQGKFGYKPSQIAHILGLSRAAISRILKK